MVINQQFMKSSSHNNIIYKEVNSKKYIIHLWEFKKYAKIPFC